MARHRKKKRTHLPHPNTIKQPTSAHPSQTTASQIPRTMVIRIGASDVGPSVSSLVHDVRTMMEPHTASRLRERRSNRLRDYVTMAGPLGVTQLLLFSRSETGYTNLRIARCPRGPTIHFRISEYSLCKDIRQALRHPKTPGKEFTTPPLLVMNNLKTPVPKNPDGTPGKTLPQDELMMSMFRSLFPEISVNTPVSAYKRVLVLNRQSPEEGNGGEYIIDVRHYAVSTKPVGLSRAIRRLNAAEKRIPRGSPDPAKIRKGAVPNLGRLDDIADYMLDPSAAGGGYTSESEVEGEEMQVEVLNPTIRRLGKKKLSARGPEKRSIRLTEIGPRLKLEMTKIEEGMADGKVLWHAYEKKTRAEERELEMRHKKRQEEKDRRRREQMENIKRKKAEKGARRKNRKEGEETSEDEGEDEEWEDDADLGGSGVENDEMED